MTVLPLVDTPLYVSTLPPVLPGNGITTVLALVPLFERVVKCELGMSSKCWLFDKEERTRKAAAYFARQRLAGAAADEPLGDWIQRHTDAAAEETV